MKNERFRRCLTLCGLIFITISQAACNPTPPAAQVQPMPQPETATPFDMSEPRATAIVATATPGEVPTGKAEQVAQIEEKEVPAMPTVNLDLEYAQVTFVRATQASNGLWRFDTTVRHNDQGWDNYADAWQVIDLDGNLLAERILLHPHDTEQPFTRSQNNIEIPPEITKVIVRAKDNVEGFGGQVVVVDLGVPAGENFEVIRYEP